jgi:hypothetical protein
MTRPMTVVFLAMLDKLESIPEYRAEIDHVRTTLSKPLREITADFFFQQYAYVILCSYWKEQYARKEWERFFKTGNADAISNIRKRAAIMWGVTHAEEWLTNLKRYIGWDHEAEYEICYLDTLPMIGPVTRYHLARNIGIDCVKPDRHLIRLASEAGYEMKDPQKGVETMCRNIQKDIGDAEKLGTIDVVLWRACNLGWI